MMVTTAVKKITLTDRWRSSLVYFLMLAKATSGFIDLPAGRKTYSSSRAQTNRSFVCSQLESMATGKGTACFALPLPVDVAFPFPFALFADRWGPEE